MNKILVIDDNELLGKMLKDALSEEGYEAQVAMDANQGYAAAIEFIPDLILLDMQLPDVQGSDLIRIIKNRDDLAHIPIIMITGSHHQTEHKVKAFQAGADDYVLKPFEMPELMERIKAVIRRCEGKMSPPANVSHASSPPVAAGNDVSHKNDKQKMPLSLKETIYRALTAPQSLHDGVLPPVTMLYLSTLLGLSLGGWALSSGSTVKPALIALGMPTFWGLCVAFLVMASSIMGISLSWKEGARLICLAGLPLLLKLLGGFVTTAVTSLSPFYFTASPAVFLKSSSIILERLDVFELWVIWLVWKMIRQCRGASKEKAWVAAAVVWPIVAFWQSLWKH